MDVGMLSQRTATALPIVTWIVRRPPLWSAPIPTLEPLLPIQDEQAAPRARGTDTLALIWA